MTSPGPDTHSATTTVPAQERIPGSGWKESYLGGSAEAEERLFRTFAAQINAVQSSNRQTADVLGIARAFHAKQIAGITNAEFRVRADLPAELAVGPFQPGARYAATLRLSNAAGTAQPDGKRDLRGFALRLRLADGRSQDFLATNAPASHARDARQFMLAATASASRSRLLVVPRLLAGLGPVETVRLLGVVVKSSRRVKSLATEPYWSRAAITWGSLAVRYVIRPAPEQLQAQQPAVDQQSPDYLREDLNERLQRGPLHFEFAVQRYVDERLTPIEDGAAGWPESASPLEVVADVVIPQQDLRGNAAQDADAAVDRLDFSPWNMVDGFRPLGSLNRARKAVYASSADFRLGRNSRARSPVQPSVIETQIGPPFWRALRIVFAAVNRFVPWHRLPWPIAIFNLGTFREVLRHENLYDTYTAGQEDRTAAQVPQFEPRYFRTRHSEGFHNDLRQPELGSAGRRFGRNVPLGSAFPDNEVALLKPSPREVSNRLLKRERFIPASSLNLLAAAWIQFQIHDWFAHEKPTTGDELEIPVKSGEWDSEVMRVRRTPPDSTRIAAEAHLPPTYRNRGSHWWDGSQIYGSDEAITRQLRSGKDGKLSIDESRFLLPVDPETGIPRSGFTDNWWVGLSLLHTLFTREHNAICDRLRSDHPYWSDDQVFDTARMINTALMAKIHTVDWTPAILAHPALQVGMRANWYGLQTATLNRIFGRITRSEAISGIPGSATDHHAAPYSLTEEFVSVYRMHPLMPDEVAFYAVRNGAPLKTLAFAETAFQKAQQVFDDGTTMADAFYSFGLAHPGAITLHNYPNFLRDLHLPDGEHLDLAAVDILRDRERGVPRYNAFRRLFHRGAARSFDDITSNKQWARQLREMYDGDIERVDLMVGMYSEDLPRGFGFSDTAFRVFILMASRRLKSDRFFTVDYTPEVYTPGGLEWIDRNSMTTVLLRHYPELAPALRHVRNAFAPWNRLEDL